MRVKSLAVLFVVICSPLVFAQQPQEFPATSGNAFVRTCSVIDKEAEKKTSVLEMQDVAVCLGYVRGVTDGISNEVAYASAITNQEPPSPFCLPEKSTNGQLVRIVLKYIGNHPEEAHETTTLLIIAALKDAFPCTAQKR